MALIVGASALAGAGLRAGAVQAGPLPGLAREQAAASIVATLTGDPVAKSGRFTRYAVVPVRVSEVRARGRTMRVRSPVLVLGDPGWLRYQLGDRVGLRGRLEVAEGPDLSAVVRAWGEPLLIARAGPVERGIAVVRSGLTRAAAPLPPPQRALVPALVDGDTSGMPAQVTVDFRTTGLTHLLAVSGSNLTLVLAFVLFCARWCGVRAHGLALAGLLAVVFFVLLARPEPSVLRAAAMGVVGLVGLSAGGARRGVRALCVAVVVLVLLDPWLARSPGFVLSTTATAGIVLLSPVWRRALGRWLPGWLAEAIAVPMSAQLVCTPAIAAISGQVSLVAVLSNLLAAPAVGPATVLGLVAGLTAVVNTWLGQLLGRLAGLPAWWIVEVAHRTAALPGASVQWAVGGAAIGALAVLCLGLVLAMPRLLGNRYAALAATAALAVSVVHPAPRLGWPPAGWVLVMCDVGQGDGLVLNAGQGTAVVVDTGPDPLAMRRCLRATRIRQVALVLLTHFHADHVDGLPAVLRSWPVAEIEVSPFAEPADRAAAVRREAAAARVPVTVAEPGERRTVGSLGWTVLGPLRLHDPEDDGAGPNNASVVVLVRSSGIRLLLAGDAQHEEQQDILSTATDLRADVLKLAHHGSANQDPAFVSATRARVALISVGAGNDYGHPAGAALGLLRELGARVYRTDLNGDVAVVSDGGRLSVATQEKAASAELSPAQPAH